MLDMPARTAPSAKPKTPSPVDVQIGGRIRLRRKMLNISQERLAEAVGVTFQQIQKYEKGSNRVGGSRMQRIAEVLGTQVGFFFETVTPEGNPQENEIIAFAGTSDGLELIRVFGKIESQKARRSIINIAQTVLSFQAQTH